MPENIHLLYQCWNVLLLLFHEQIQINYFWFLFNWISVSRALVTQLCFKHLKGFCRLSSLELRLLSTFSITFASVRFTHELPSKFYSSLSAITSILHHDPVCPLGGLEHLAALPHDSRTQSQDSPFQQILPNCWCKASTITTVVLVSFPEHSDDDPSSRQSSGSSYLQRLGHQTC